MNSEFETEVQKAMAGLDELHGLWLGVVQLDLRLRRCKQGSPKWLDLNKKREALANRAMEFTSTIRLYLKMSIGKGP